MIKIFKQKISPIIAFLFVLIFGYYAIFLMDRIFKQYAQDELLTERSQAKSGLVQVNK
jgi:hypothetical protein